MSDTVKEAVVHRFYEEFCNDRRLDLADELLTSDFRYHDPQSPEIMGPQAMAQTVAVFQQSLNGHWHVDELVAAAGDRVVARWTGIGTHAAALMGIPATGKSVRVSALSLFRIERNKIAEGWTVWDTLGLLQQLGVVPQSEGVPR